MQPRALIQVAARRLLLLASRTRKGRRAGGKKAVHHAAYGIFTCLWLFDGSREDFYCASSESICISRLLPAGEAVRGKFSNNYFHQAVVKIGAKKARLLFASNLPDSPRLMVIRRVVHCSSYDVPTFCRK